MAYSKKINSQTAKSGANLITPFVQGKGVFIGAWKVENSTKWNIKIFQSEKQVKEPLTKSKQGKLWAVVTVVCTAPLRNTVIVSGLMNIANHKVYIKEWNWMCNPKAPNGSYIGKHISKQ